MSVTDSLHFRHHTPVKSSRRLSSMLVLMVLLLPATLFGYTAWRAYNDAIAQAKNTSQRTVWVIREHALKVFETHELVLRELKQRVNGQDWHTLSSDTDLRSYLVQLGRTLPHVSAVTLADGRGSVRASSRLSDIGRSIADSDYFAAHERGNTREFISRSYARTSSRDRYFTISIPRVADDGRFDGVLSIEVSLGYFTEFWRQLAPEIAYIVPMIRADGELLVRYPVTENPQRLDPNGPFVQATRRSDNGVYVARSMVDGVERMNAYTKIGPYPLYVSFSVETREILTQWRHNLWRDALFALIATAALVAAAVIVMRERRRELQAAERWHDTATRLEGEIERRRHAEDDLRQAQKMETIGEITGGVAHDFNNLLQSVSLNLQLAQATIGDSAATKYLTSASNALHRGAKLIQQLLAFARRQPLTPRALDLNKLVVDMSDMLQRTLGDRVRIEVEAEKDLWPAMIDRVQAEMAILNLCVNARDAMPDGGVFTVRTGNVPSSRQDHPLANRSMSTDDHVMLAITDTGVGMSEETRKRACEPFFTTKGAGKGSGLGLSQVQGFAAQSGGFVAIDSRPGGGTSVTLYVPRAYEDAVDLDDAEQQLTAEGSGESILVVDDEAIVRRSVADTLQNHGYSVLEARNGADALELLRQTPAIRLMVTDFSMPGMQGDELARYARAERPDLPIVLITGYADMTLPSLAEWKDALLQKPFTSRALVVKVHDLLRTRQPSAN